LTQATAEVSGGVHYRQPALQTVREVLNEVDGRRIRLHRLMEYNNDPETTLDDIYKILKISEQRLEKRV
jgi:DNA-directed RNA polymerase sigma subunit (sigma70/sigma32)